MGSGIVTWEVGDLAVCVDDSPSYDDGKPCPFRRGAIYRVSGVCVPGRWYWGRVCLEPALSFQVPKVRGVAAFRFRKPDAHEGSAQSWEFILELTKRKSPTPAEREKRILEALFPHERPRVSPTSGGEE